MMLIGAMVYNIRGCIRELPALTAVAEAMAAGEIDTANLDAGTEKTRNEISQPSRAFAKTSEVVSFPAGEHRRMGCVR